MWKQTQRSPEEEIDLREGRKTKRNKKKTRKPKKQPPQKKTKIKTKKTRKPKKLTGPKCLRHRFFFSGPKGRMQRVASFHAPREGCRELSLVICFFSCPSMHMSKQRMCKGECKKRTLTVPSLFCNFWPSVRFHCSLAKFARSEARHLLGQDGKI